MAGYYRVRRKEANEKTKSEMSLLLQATANWVLVTALTRRCKREIDVDYLRNVTRVSGLSDNSARE